MYIMINNIIGEERIDLSCRIKNFDSSKKVAVVSLHIIVTIFNMNSRNVIVQNWD